MNSRTVFKVKDSVDLFLSNEKYIMAYFMNSRQRKSFRANDDMLHLFELIDGEKDVQTLQNIMHDDFEINPECTSNILTALLKSKIITEVVKEQNILPDSAVRRYSRQINYFSEFLEGEIDGIKAQKKLMDTHVLIFGCGAIGGNIAMELAMAGIGYISLYDYDTVEESDISRHIFYRDKYLGQPKTTALEVELKAANSEIQVVTYNDSMKPTSDIEKIIEAADFIVNTLDEPYIGYTASKISRICVKHKKPHFIAGGFDAHLSSTGELIIPYVTPCVECYADHFKVALEGWKPKKHPVKSRYTEIGGLASTSLFSSSYACIEILKYIAGLTKMEEDYKIRGEFLFHDMSLTYLDVNKNPHCPVCGGVFENET